MDTGTGSNSFCLCHHGRVLWIWNRPLRGTNIVFGFNTGKLFTFQFWTLVNLQLVHSVTRQMLVISAFVICFFFSYCMWCTAAVFSHRVAAPLTLSSRLSLPKDAKKFFDSDTKVLEVPLTVQVAGQVRILLHCTVWMMLGSTGHTDCLTNVQCGTCVRLCSQQAKCWRL